MNSASFLIQDQSIGLGVVGAIFGAYSLLCLYALAMYVGMCCLIAHLAKQKGHTNWRWGIFAIFSTPIIAAIYLAAAAQRPTAWSGCGTTEDVDEFSMPTRRRDALLP